MSGFSIDELVQILRECAGEDEATSLDGDILRVSFEELGYDSLALLNTVGRIERDLRIKLPEGVVTESGTPGELLDLVNAEVAGQVRPA